MKRNKDKNMDEFKQIYTKKKRNMLIKAEKERLDEIFGDIDDLATGLIDQAAFLRAELTETEEIIKRDGIMEVYKNGANQLGQKKSSAVEVHDKFANTYIKTLKGLAEIRGGGSKEGMDEFQAFISGAKKEI